MGVGGFSLMCGLVRGTMLICTRQAGRVEKYLVVRCATPVVCICVLLWFDIGSDLGDFVCVCMCLCVFCLCGFSSR